MKVYHMSQTLKLDEELQAGYNGNAEQCDAFVKALEKGEDCIHSMIVSKKAETEKWNDYVKWCVEGVFEFVRKTEFPSIPSRLNCNYYFEDLAPFKTLYQAGWAQEPEEERAKIRLYEVKLDEECPIKCDMMLFDEAYDRMFDSQNIKAVINCARKYFSGGSSTNPIWEIISDKHAKAVKDISEHLKAYAEQDI